MAGVAGGPVSGEIVPAPGAGVNPLSGLPLEAWQALVIGAPATGPRRTVVDTRPGATVPRWITVVGDAAGGRVYVDNGVAGGTYSGPQVLPEVTVRGAFLGPLVAVVVLILAGLFAGARPRARAA